jgi:hypothetical protein
MRLPGIRRWFGGLEARSRAALALVIGLASTACGPGFDSPAKVKELRILGVEKDKPYPAPGETVELTMLWHDPKLRSMNRFWSPLCVNPLGDLYYGCFADPSFFQGDFTTGDVMQGTVPANIISSRPPPTPGQPQYGLLFAFFAICSGEIALETPSQEGALPIVCRDTDGKLLGPDDFIVGYTSMYVFPHRDDASIFIRNQNPPLTGIEIAGTPALTRTCVDAGCVADPPLPLEDVDCTDPANAPVCFDACADDGDATCPAIPIKPSFDPTRDIAERDEVSKEYYGRDVGEQMWINYYVDRGGTRSDVRLLNDAVEGLNQDYGTDFFAPKESGPVTIWAVTRDNRGGASWVRTRVGIR